MSMYYNRAGDPIDREEFARLFTPARTESGEPDPYRTVGRDVIVDPLGRKHTVSTVWLGLDHGYRGAPLIFETMVFCDHDEPCEWDEFQDRYSTEHDAEHGHAATATAVRNGDLPEGLDPE